MTTSTTLAPGCSFLVAQAGATHAPLLTPETVPEEHRALAATIRAFGLREIDPITRQLETHDGDAPDSQHHRKLLKRLGELGALGIEIPERFGGLGLDHLAASLAFEALNECNNGSFIATYGAHTGIGTAPLLHFGTEAQRAEFLPGIADGSTIASYALTEPGSGSDALAARTHAERQPDGSWILNGEKSFISNGGLSSLFTVFAKVDGKNACFLVRRDTPGFTVGAEERKHGIRGSSTCGLGFIDVRLPPEALLGEVGQGHKIVLNTLNLGRAKIASACVGVMKRSLREAAAYAAERKQFGKRIDSFGAIRQMLAKTAIDLYVGESITYALTGLLQGRLAGEPHGLDAAKAIHEYSVECALAKAMLSDMLYAAADREVQILGGNGVMEDYGAERRLRDARTIRIFEGTNEINRLAAIGDFLKRVLAGKIQLPEPDAFESHGTRIGLNVYRLIMAAAEDFGADIIGEQTVLLELASLLELALAVKCASGRVATMPWGAPGRPFAMYATSACLERYDAALTGAQMRLRAYAGSRGKWGKLNSPPRQREWDHTPCYEHDIADLVIAAGGYPL